MTIVYYNYKVVDKIIIINKSAYKYKTPYKGPYKNPNVNQWNRHTKNGRNRRNNKQTLN